MSDSLEVWIDCDLCPIQQLGTLFHDRVARALYSWDFLLGVQDLTLDDVDNRPSLDTVLTTAPFYRLRPARAREIIAEVANVVTDWKSVARRATIAAADIEFSASAFTALD